LSLPVAQNALVPLCYLSPVKNTALFVRARIYNSANTLLATRDLTHIEDGRYTDATYFYPNEPSIKVRYDVYSDAGYTIPDQCDGSVDDRFHKLDTPTALIRNDQITIKFTDTTEVMKLNFGDKGMKLNFVDNDAAIKLKIESEGVKVNYKDTTESYTVNIEC